MGEPRLAHCGRGAGSLRQVLAPLNPLVVCVAGVGRKFRAPCVVAPRSMIRKSGNRFSEKIMLKQRDEIMMRFHLIAS
jgi:hypothetical protein